MIDGREVELQERDIADDPALMATYGISIPVLKNLTTQAECFWPFDQRAVRQLIAN